MRMPNARLIAVVATAAALSLAATPAHAQGGVRAAFRLGGDFGGEKVLEFEYEDGSTPDVKAGNGFIITGGGVASLLTRAGHGLDAQVNVGLKYSTIPPAENQEVTWLRWPVEALLYYRTPKGLRLGAGTAVHLANTIEASGGVVNGNVDFKATPGLLLQAEYMHRNVSFDVRYTAMEYEVSKGGSGTVGASSFGAGFSLFLGRPAQK
jgi:hypothetical protein